MNKWLKRIRGAVGMGLTWAVAWSVAGALVALGFVIRTGSRPDAPFPIMFAAAGFAAGLIFSGVLGLVDGRRKFEEMSIRRFAGWGAAGGFALATAFVVGVSLSGDPGFLWNLLSVGPLFAAAAAGSAAGSLALARRSNDLALLGTAEDPAVAGIQKAKSREALRNSG